MAPRTFSPSLERVGENVALVVERLVRGSKAMIRTSLCALLGIEHPIVQGPIWPATSPELVAAVSNAGGLGSLAAVFESAADLEHQVTRVRELTGRPFAINHVVPLLDEEAFAYTLAARPAVISFALADPGDHGGPRP